MFRFSIAAIFLFCCIVNSSNAQTTDGYVPVSNDVKLYYTIYGSKGDTIVMLHGGPAFDQGYLAPDLTKLSENNVLVYYDQRGGGRSTLVSDSSSVTLTAHINDLEAIRRYFKINHMTVFGHSWGALLAARYAKEFPANVEKIIFASPAPPRRVPHLQQAFTNISIWMDSSTRANVALLRAARTDTTKDINASCREFWKFFARGYFVAPDAALKVMKGDFCTAPPAGILNGLKISPYIWGSLGQWDWRQDFLNIRIPVLIITGTKDIIPIESMYEWKTAFRNSKLVLIEGSSHYPQIEQPQQFFAAVEAFLKSR